MAIAFDDIPEAQRQPEFFVEFDNKIAAADSGQLPFTILVVGQKTAAGSAPVEVPQTITDDGQADVLFGAGSHLARMIRTARTNNSVTKLVGMAVDDAGGAVAAEKTVTVTGTATASGTVALYVAGRRIAVGVAEGDLQNDITTAIETALDADAQIPYDTAVVMNVATLTAKNAGLLGNDIDVRTNYRDDDEDVPGVTVVIADTTVGTLNPTTDDLIAALGDDWYQTIAWPWTDSTNLDAIRDELLDRFGPVRQIDGYAVAGAIGTIGTLSALGNTRNEQTLSIIHATGEPVPHWEKAAAASAQVASSASIDPARPFQTLQLIDILPPESVDKFTQSELNSLLFNGISTSVADAGGLVRIGRMITTYKTTPSGEPDESFLNLETLYTLQFLRFDFRTFIVNKYPRHKLADDGTRFASGQPVMTPSLGRAEALAWFQRKENDALVEGRDQFEENLVVERNVDNRNRLDWLLPPNLINQFIIGAAKIQFRI